MDEFRLCCTNRNALSENEYFSILDEFSTSEKFDPEILLSALSDYDPIIRCYAARKIGTSGHGSQNIIIGLSTALLDNYTSVRQYAAAALGILQPPATPAIEALKLATNDVDPVVREFSAASLLMIEKQMRRE